MANYTDISGPLAPLLRVTEAVNTAEGIGRTLPRLDEMLTDGMGTTECINVVSDRVDAR